MVSPLEPFSTRHSRFRQIPRRAAFFRRPVAVLCALFSLCAWLTGICQSQDWTVAADPLSMPLRPANDAVVKQNSPDFSWPAADEAKGYELELTTPTGSQQIYPARQNFYNLNEKLPVGLFSWRVRFQQTNDSWSDWSVSRKFTIPTDAIEFLVPSENELWSTLLHQPHPRCVLTNPMIPIIKNTLEQERHAWWKTFQERATQLATQTPPSEPTAATNEASGGQSTQALPLMIQASSELLELGFAYRITNESKYGDAAEARLLALAAWNPNGPTGHRNVPWLSQVITESLALGYDWLYPQLSSDDRRKVLATILARQRQANDLMAVMAKAPAKQPYNLTRCVMWETGLIVACSVGGDAPESEKWFRDLVPFYINQLPLWGGEDGGWASGTYWWASSAQWTLWVMDVLNSALDLKLYRKAWAVNNPRFAIYCLPPGSPRHLFGQPPAELVEAAMTTVQPQLICLRLAGINQDPVAQWYANLRTKMPADMLLPELWLNKPVAPEPPHGRSWPTGTCFNDIGLAAMHNSLANTNRISVYFKSSPFGSIKPCHADQNSFLINAYGQALAIESDAAAEAEQPGQWNCHTRAHNIITFDGGHGQADDDKSASGRIVSFQHRDEFDVVTGDATAAYKGALNRARRTLVYLRPDVIVIYDDLTSETPRSWEWNLHALSKFVDDNGIMRTCTGNIQLNVRLLTPTGCQTNQLDLLHPDPTKPATATNPGQFQLTYVTAEKSVATKFLAVLSVARPNSPVQAAKLLQSGKRIGVSVADFKVMFGPDGNTTVDSEIP